MKWILLIGLLLLLLVMAIFSLPFLIDLTKYQEQYRPAIEQALNRKVTLQDIRLTIWPRIGARMAGFAIQDDPAFRAGPFASLASLDVGVKLMPLLSGKVEVEEITLREPVITVLKNTQGVMNISTLGAQDHKAPEKREPAEKPSDESALKILALLAVDRVGITHGTLTYRDESTPTPTEYAVQNLEFLLRSVRLGQTPTLHVTATVQPYNLPITLTGAAGPLVESLDFKQIDLDLALGTVLLSLKGSAVAGHAHGTLTSPAIHSKDLPLALPLTKPVMITDVFVDVDADYPPKPNVPPLRMATINALRAAIGMGASSIGLTGSLKDGRLALAAASKNINTADLPVAVPLKKPFDIKEVDMKAEVTDQRATLSHVALQIFGGQVTGHAGLKLGHPTPPFDAKLAVKGLQLGQAVDAFATDKALVSGTASADLTLDGAGFAMADLTRALTGTGHLVVKDGTLDGVNLTQEVLNAFKVVGLSAGDAKATAFSTIEGDVAIQQGVVQLQRFLAESHDFQATASGTIGFDQSLNVSAMLNLSEALSRTVAGASAAGRFMASKGRISVPLTITGTTAAPSYRVDLKAVAGKVGEQLKEKVGEFLKRSPATEKLLEQGGGALKNLFGR
ncbi:MAG: AsmA family protein [Nitrospira sp.]|nr:MAG: AsmA family protein [Nitrospira sp.]